MSHQSSSLAVSVRPDPLLLERVVVRRQVAAVLEKPHNGNGNGNGNGYGDNGGYAEANSEAGSPWSLNPGTGGMPAPPAEPREIDFAPSVSAAASGQASGSSVSFTAPQPVSAAPQSSSIGGGPMAFVAPAQMPDSAASDAPPAPPGVMPVAGSSSDNPWMSGNTAASAGGGGVAAQVMPTLAPQTAQQAANSFINAAANAAAANPPQPAPDIPPPVPVAPASPPQVAAAAELAPGASMATEPAPPAAASSNFFAEPLPASRSDFFASAAAPAKEESDALSATGNGTSSEAALAPPVASPANPSVPPSAAAPPSGDSATPLASAEADQTSDLFDEPAPSQPTKKAASAPATGGPETFDFFASTSFTPIAERRAAEREAGKPPPPPSSSRGDIFTDEAPSRPSRRKEPVDQDDDEEERPKVAPPLGYKPKDSAVTLKTHDRDEDDDEDDDDDNDNDKKSSRKKSQDLDSTPPPPRRSFTSKSETAPKKQSKKKSSDDDDSDHDHDDDDKSKPNEKSDKAGAMAFFEQQVNFFGLTMSRMNQVFLIGILGFVATVVLLVGATIIGSLTGAGGGGQPQQQQQQAAAPQTLSGKWAISTNSAFGRWSGMMTLVQRTPEKFDAAGKDQGGNGQVLPYDASGEVKSDGTINFAKAYRLLDQQTGEVVHDKPIYFTGRYGITAGSLPIARGTWYTKKSQGHFLHHTVKTIAGDWEAQMVQSTTPGMGSDPQQPDNGVVASGLSQSQSGGIGSTSLPNASTPMASEASDFKWPWDSWPMSTRFLAMAALAIGGIGLIVAGSLTLFGPGGKMNIWEKEKYIPTQFKTQHRKMLRELCKPLRPGGMPLGRRCEWRIWKPWEWAFKELAMPPEMRVGDPHMLVLGAGDKGKTRLIATMVTHDILANDRAVIVIDSDGGLTDMVTRWIAANPKGKEMAKRVILLDPTAKHGAPGYNPLELPEDGDLQTASSAIVYGFKAMYTEPPGAQSQWNAQTANILRNCALLLIANGKTLTDIPTLFNDNDFRDVMLEAVEKKKHDRSEYITLLETWGQYKKLARTDQWINWTEPILNRVTPMLSDSRIRNILTKPHGEINLRKIIQEKKVLLVRVAKGQLDQNANLLGSLIVTGVKQAAQSLASENSKDQNPVALYLDEFDNFIEKETIETICKETDKFKIGFIGAIKTLQHLPEDFRNQIVINVGTCACFALAKKDGDVLGPQMFRVDGRKIKHQTIQNFFNKVNTSPQFELISDEEKLNIDRVVGQELRTFYCYRVGTPAGVFRLKAHDFDDIPDKDVNFKLLDRMRGLKTTSDKKATAASPVADTETAKTTD